MINLFSKFGFKDVFPFAAIVYSCDPGIIQVIVFPTTVTPGIKLSASRFVISNSGPTTSVIMISDNGPSSLN